MKKYIALLAFALFNTARADAALDELRALNPAPDLSFTEVVKIQLSALANDNANHAGIALAYRFAAPSNKREVGPLARFITLFETELYAPMLNPRETEFLDSAERENLAYQRVRIKSADGRDFYYLFILERQQAGELKDCWMTIGVRTFMRPPRLRRDSPGRLTLPSISAAGHSAWQSSE